MCKSTAPPPPPEKIIYESLHSFESMLSSFKDMILVLKQTSSCRIQVKLTICCLTNITFYSF